MSTQTTTAAESEDATTSPYLVGAAGGFVGSVLFGLIMTYVMPPPLLEMVIPAMYGVEGPAPLVGWAFHQFHGVVLGVVYVAAVQSGSLAEPARKLGSSVGLGVGYGVLTTAVLAVLVMPLWLQAVGFPAAPPFPNVAVPGTILTTIGHIVYALPVTVGYALFAEK